MPHQGQRSGWGLHAFGHQLEVEGFSKADDCPDDRQITTAGAQVANERRVDLEVGQNRVARAEVVDGNLDSDFFQRLECLAGGVDVANHGALGDLQAHRATVNAELVDGFGHAADKTSADQLGR